MSDLEDNDVEDQRITRSMSKRSNSLNNQYDNILDKRIKKLKRSELENIVKYSFSKYIVNDNDIVNEINKSDKNINEIQITNIKKKKKKKELVNEEDSENIEEISDEEDDDYEDNEDNEYEDDDEYEDEDDEYEDEINDYYETIENEIKPNENYFKSLEKEEQLKIIELEKKIQKLQKYDIPIKYQILQSNLDINIKCICMEKLEILQCSESESDEIQKIKIWLETILKIPFGIFKNSAITLNNSSTEINEYLFNIYNKLNESLYGQTAAKCQILQYISQCISNPNCAGNVIGLCGPPGCGKTTLIKHGVSKAIDFISELGIGTNYREKIINSYKKLSLHEFTLASQLFEGLNKLKSIKIIGPDFSSRDRTPTVSFVHKSKSANEICKELAKHNICAWDGHFYALKAIQKLGLEKRGGVTRLGISVYNQSHEIDRTIKILSEI